MSCVTARAQDGQRSQPGRDGREVLAWRAGRTPGGCEIWHRREEGGESPAVAIYSTEGAGRKNKPGRRETWIHTNTPAPLQNSLHGAAHRTIQPLRAACYETNDRDSVKDGTD